MVQLREIDVQNYPKLCGYIRKDFPLVTGSQTIWLAFLNCSGMDEPTARDSITGGIKSPQLIVVALSGEGSFEPEWPDNVELASDLASQFENDSAKSEAQALVTVTILTQVVAWRRAKEGGTAWRNYAQRFPSLAYGDDVPQRYWGIAAPSSGSLPKSINDLAARAFNYFVACGWTKAQSAGIVASIEAESSFDPTCLGDHGHAYGLCQWQEPRQPLFSKAYGKPIQQSSFDEQLAFVDYELRNGDPLERKAATYLRAAETASVAGWTVCYYYERPYNKDADSNKRAAMAENWYQRFAQ